MRRISALLMLLTVSACQTCRNRPVACAGLIGIAAVSAVIATGRDGGSRDPHDIPTPTSPCSPDPNACR